MQTASAFNSVQAALSYFINAYRQLAEWRAVIARLEGFNLAVEKGWSAVRAEPAIQVRPQDQEWVKLDDLLVCLPQSKPLVAARDLLLRAGESVLVIGPSGAGKSTLFRAIAGAWPFGSGVVSIPRGVKLMNAPAAPLFSHRLVGGGNRVSVGAGRLCCRGTDGRAVRRWLAGAR